MNYLSKRSLQAVLTIIVVCVHKEGGHSWPGSAVNLVGEDAQGQRLVDSLVEAGEECPELWLSLGVRQTFTLNPA